MDGKKKKNKKKKGNSQSKLTDDVPANVEQVVVPNQDNGSSPQLNHLSQVSSTIEFQSGGVSQSDMEPDKHKIKLQEEIRQLEDEKNLWLQKEVCLEEKIQLLQSDVDSCLKKEVSLEEKIQLLQSDVDSCLKKEASFEEKLKSLQSGNDLLIQKQAIFEDRVNYIEGIKDSWILKEMSTRVLPSKESKTRREVLVWTTHMDNIFIESMLFQHREGNHQDGVFSSCAYNDMLKDMNEKFPSMNIKRENLKNRLKTIKQNFSKCYDIFKSASNSGFGWNPESKKWEAEPEVWEILVQSKPEAAEWRIKSINKYDELEELFVKDRATGEGAETAKEKKRRWAKTKANSVCEDNVDIVDGTDFLFSRNEINLEGFSGVFEGDNVDVEILPDVPSSQVPSQSGATSSKGKRRKNETLEEGLITSLDKIANAIERSTDAILQRSASLGRFCSRVISSEEITEALEEMGVEGQFFDDAFEFLSDNPEKAKKIFGYPKMGRLRYLEKLVYPTYGTS